MFSFKSRLLVLELTICTEYYKFKFSPICFLVVRDISEVSKNLLKSRIMSNKIAGLIHLENVDMVAFCAIFSTFHSQFVCPFIKIIKTVSLGEVLFSFNPHILPAFRGMMSTIYCNLQKNINIAVTNNEFIGNIFQHIYQISTLFPINYL